LPHMSFCQIWRRMLSEMAF
jgi:Folylpolyglutamate synthase